MIFPLWTGDTMMLDFETGELVVTKPHGLCRFVTWMDGEALVANADTGELLPGPVPPDEILPVEPFLSY